MRAYRYVENRRAMEQVACTMACYTRMKGRVPDLNTAELRERRNTVKRARYLWAGADRLPCGHQDALGDRISQAYADFYACLNALRLLRGRVPPTFQDTLSAAVGA